MQARSSDAYFLASGGRVSFFFEEGAFDAEGALAVPVERAINKIGHALHDVEPAFQRISYSPAVKALATAAGLRAPQVVQSMCVRLGRRQAPAQLQRPPPRPRPPGTSPSSPPSAAP